MGNLATQGNMPKILELEEIMRGMTQVESPAEHYHLKGVYARSVVVPAGCTAAGKIHNHESIGILAQGTMRITTGSNVVTVSAPYISVEAPGIKRLVYAETDCTFITVHRTDLTSIEAMEEELVSDTFEAYEQKQNLLEDMS
jgi:quercetin dioxygenase-like cupin family protein